MTSQAGTSPAWVDHPPPPPLPVGPKRPVVGITVDSKTVEVAEKATILDACRAAGIAIPTLCWAENLTPVNVCRVCVVELEGARTLVPACSREVEPGMVVHTDSERVRHSRRLVLELLASATQVDRAPELESYLELYGARDAIFGPAPGPAWRADHEQANPGEQGSAQGAPRATVAQPVKIDNELYVRDYSRCILCYRCVEACGEDAQSTFAIAVAGRGFQARISTEFDVSLPGSACVFCGNCIAVCPTGALMAKSEYDMRESAEWDEQRQTHVETVCTYCGVGCPLVLHVQDNRIVKASSPVGSSVTHGHLCIKGRFGWQFVQTQEPSEEHASARPARAPIVSSSEPAGAGARSSIASSGSSQASKGTLNGGHAT